MSPESDRVPGDPPPSPFEDLDAIRRRLRGGPALVALDFDGTLTEIVDDPTAPGLTGERRRLLERIPGPDRWLAVVSGRALEDVRNRVGVANALYVGNHGVEIEGPGIRMRPPAEVAGRLETLLDRLPAILEEQGLDDGVAVENKRWTATLHVRPRGDAQRHAALGDAIENVVVAAGFELRPGKASWEIRPAQAPDKGDAIRHLIETLPGATAHRSLYVGDDVTDEDAFRALTESLTVRVGEPDPPTAARYRLPDPAAVYDLLAALFGSGDAG